MVRGGRACKGILNLLYRILQIELDQVLEIRRHYGTCPERDLGNGHRTCPLGPILGKFGDAARYPKGRHYTAPGYPIAASNRTSEMFLLAYQLLMVLSLY